MFFPRIALASLLLAPALAIDNRPPAEALITHEWGTFTSVAGEDGRPVRWLAFSGPADLPCFVERLSDWNPKFLAGMIRMETPVLYFYAPRPMTVSVGVQFPQGWITEWYPRASSVMPRSVGRMVTPGAPLGNRSWANARGEIRWDAVDILPGPDPQYPRGKQPSPYYAARHTDSAPLRIGKQDEKLIFYRGIGDFDVPLRPVFTENAWQLRNSGSDTIPLAILFENRDGEIGYRKVAGLKDTVRLEAPELTASLAGLERELVEYLVEFGLYRREAEAMLETWSDTWFEPGMRVIYIVPRPLVDAVLPLEIVPAPTRVARVFVGRAELLSPWVRQQIETAAAENNVRALENFGRFLEPFAAQIGGAAAPRSRPIETASGNLLRQQFDGPGCVQ
jgi:hypothetical protein